MARRNGVRGIALVGVVALAVLSVTGVVAMRPAIGLGQHRWTADAVVEAFQIAGLEVSTVRDIHADPHPELPAPYADGLAFYTPDSALCMCPGYEPEVQVMAFDGRRRARKAQQHYEALIATKEWDYVQSFALDNVIVLATADIPYDLFLEYQASLSG